MPTHSDIPRVDTPARAGAGARLVRVPDDRAGQRLDNFLLGQLKGAPRSLVYKLVRSGQVRVNGGRARAERKLEIGDEVRIPPLRLPEAGERGTPARGLLDAMDAAIVFEDDRLLVVDKPSGVASHGGSGVSFGVIETLRALRPAQTLELVHRLDRDTSGVLVVAKKRAALSELQALMRGEGGIAKRYLALLAGRMPDGTMSVDAPLHVGLRQGGERHLQFDHAADAVARQFQRIFGRRRVDGRDPRRWHRLRRGRRIAGGEQAGREQGGEGGFLGARDVCAHVSPPRPRPWPRR